jgi:hypothetical protein
VRSICFRFGIALNLSSATRVQHLANYHCSDTTVAFPHTLQ